MKTIDELGISPCPWDFQPNHPDGCRVATAYNRDVSTSDPANARLIASSPDLYECLREAVLGICRECEGKKIENCRGKCFYARWRDALAKAAGENEE